MKIRSIIIVLLSGALFFLEPVVHAGVPDADALNAIEAMDTIPSGSLPVGGLFYSAAYPNGPPMPGSMGYDAWQIDSNTFLLDDLKSGGFSGRGMRAMDDSSPPGFDDSGDGTNYYQSSFTPQVFTTNDLWLSITGKTNSAAHLVIHPPWNMTNGVWGLYFKTNLTVPYNWTWLLRNAPSQTNLVATNLPPAQGFFMLGDPTAIRPGFTNNILAANDDGSTGLVPVGFPINFFGTSYANLYVNNNGNVTFDNYLSDFTPNYTILQEVQSSYYEPGGMIAPFWADVDTEGSGSGVTAYGTNTVDGHVAFGSVGSMWDIIAPTLTRPIHFSWY